MLDSNISAFIQAQLADTIAQKQLTKPLLDLIYQKKWFNLWVPTRYAGLGAELAAGCRLLEELAYIDGGFGWTVTLCAGANMFAGFIAPDLAEQIFKQAQVCWGGSGKPAGRADKLADGYRISGLWKYATGAPHLSHFTLNAWLYEDGAPVLDEAGIPQYRSFFVDREDVLIHYDWNTFGLECTASHSFSVEELIVAQNRAFDLQPDKRTLDDPLFRYPFMTFAECTLAVNYIGMFRRFLDLTERYFFVKAADASWAKTRGKVLFKQIDQLRTDVDQSVARLYMLMEQTWNLTHTAEEHMGEISTLSRFLVGRIKEETIRLFPYLGIYGAQRENEVNRVFRHLFTASQHALLNTES